MLDFLNETTYSNDALANGDLSSTIGSMLSAEDTEPGHGLVDLDDNDLIEIMGKMDDEDAPVQDEESNPNEQEGDDDEDDEDGMIDPDIMAYLFDREPDNEGGSSIRNAQGSVGNVDSIPVGLQWLKTKTQNVNLGGLNANISKYLNTLPDNLKNSLVATSGNDDRHARGSKHYSNNAVDLRFDEQAYNYMMNDPVFQKMGLNILPPDHGTAKHLHIETKQFGGAVASTAQQKYVGLNNPSHSEMFFPMQGRNTFRGLDNNQPVLVTDGSKYQVLKGKHDTATFNGNVYEKRL